MFSMPLSKIRQRLQDRVARSHNLPKELQDAAIQEELDRGWDEIMGKAENYRQGSHILDGDCHFSTMSLGNWITLCETAGVPMAPSRFAATINPVTVFALSAGHDPAQFMDDLQQFIPAFQDIEDDEIIRFDTSAPNEVKALMTLGRADGETPAWRGYRRNDSGIVFPQMSDERLVSNLMANPENSSPVWIRKWVEPVMMTGCRTTGWQRAVMPEDRLKDGETLPAGAGDLFPCEWRVYVKNGEITAISNYYTAIDRGVGDDAPIALAMAAEARDHAQSLLDTIKSLNVVPHHPMYEHRDDLDPDAIHFSLDFLEVADETAPMGRKLIMLEGGPAHLRNPNWGAHPCCFGPARDPKGLALSADDIRPLECLT